MKWECRAIKIAQQKRTKKTTKPPTDKGRRLKLYYMTQASTKPPTFVVFVNDKKLFHFSYERYLVNQLRKEFGLVGTPIRMIAREKIEKNEKSNTK